MKLTTPIEVRRDETTTGLATDYDAFIGCVLVRYGDWNETVGVHVLSDNERTAILAQV